jgi:mannose-6-phosphate isomerase-like protein (cupin superfamily)
MIDKLRRVVTGHNAEGKSIVALDGPPGSIVGTERAGLGEIWITDGTPADNRNPADAGARPVRLEPPVNGSIFRFFVLAPPNKQLSAQQLEEQAADGFRAIGGEHCRVDTRLDPAMHTTRTVDYIILLKGDVTLVLDEDEVRLKPFDVVVQRGTNHAWRNNGSEPALLAGVLIDALPV